MSFGLGLAIGLLGASAWGPDAARAAAAEQPAEVHTVVIFLKADAPRSALDAVVADGRERLQEVSGVKSLQTVEAIPDVSARQPRLGLLLLFDSAAGVNRYLKDPRHHELISRHRASVDRVRVWRFVDAPE